MRRALTLIEVLSVIGIMGLLIGLLLSGVQKIRATAARVHCQNNLKQIGLALHHYSDANGELPSGVVGDQSNDKMPFSSWCLHLLPFFDQAALWQQAKSAYATDRDFLRNPPHAGLSTPLRDFQCPSDGRVRRAASPSNQPLRAFTSYLGVEGYDALRCDGVLFLDSHTRFAEVTDGLSNTLAVGERPPSKDLMFGWWYAGWGQAKDGEGDMLLGVATRNNMAYAPDCPSGPYDFKPGEFNNQCDAFHFWSPHTGGANFMFADGSVRFLKYSANSIMPALASRAGGESVEVP